MDVGLTPVPTPQRRLLRLQLQTPALQNLVESVVVLLSKFKQRAVVSWRDGRRVARRRRERGGNESRPLRELLRYLTHNRGRTREERTHISVEPFKDEPLLSLLLAKADLKVPRDPCPERPLDLVPGEGDHVVALVLVVRLPTEARLLGQTETCNRSSKAGSVSSREGGVSSSSRRKGRTAFAWSRAEEDCQMEKWVSTSSVTLRAGLSVIYCCRTGSLPSSRDRRCWEG